MPFDHAAYMRERRKDPAFRERQRAATARYREQHREQLNEASKAYYHANKEQIAEKRKHRVRKDVLRKYDLSPGEYDALLERQGGGCAACGTTTCRVGRSLSVDHDHVTGEIRGILCADCNLALGFVKDSVERLQRLIVYLEGGQTDQRTDDPPNEMTR